MTSAVPVQNPSSKSQNLVRVLGIETATFCGGVALLGNDRLIASRTLYSSKTHSGRLLAAIRDLLSEAECSLHDLTGLAVSIGPGSFTGVRIGVAAAKGLAVALHIPIVGISTLEALAVRAGRDGRLLCTVLDARRNEVFAAAYFWPQPADRPKPVLAGGVMPLSSFMDQLAALESRRTSVGKSKIQNPKSKIASGFLFLGDGALRYRREIEQRLAARAEFAPAHRILPSAEEIAWLGLQRLLGGQSDDPALLEPVYLRASDARLPAEKGGV
ncbi:MAG: tRNA (adenosine(37)-N6)-threonylcarbamoyltransferase complex dimerization subunit type 1 TsaB [Candidatus Sumerlaeia bacterium]|nr:tRNA (adenosine(37)-N6)-threonylcarbamoyltransferase complex dimerization subunit type 1 TsaB [Candidatus Sumerlaeia bacterium]